MSTLRWILLVLGTAVIAVIYFIGRRQEQDSSFRREPALGHGDNRYKEPQFFGAEAVTDEPEPELIDFDDLIARGLESEVAAYRPVEKFESPNKAEVEKTNSMLLEQELVVLNLFAQTHQSFHGEALYAALDNAGFTWNSDQLFQCQGLKGEYLALNALKPGTFPEQATEFETRAVALILQLSKVGKPLEAFDEFISLAHQLQSDLDARLCDSQRSSLTKQTITYLHDEVQQYQFKHR